MCHACSLHCEHMLWSRKPSRAQLTVVTQATVDRLPMLLDQCASYRGPLAAALHLPLIQAEEDGLTPANRQAVARAVEAVEKLFEQWVPYAALLMP